MVEPRCRVCRDPALRRRVNRCWTCGRFPVPGGGEISYTAILDGLEPFNAVLPPKRSDHLIPACGTMLAATMTSTRWYTAG